MGERDSHVDAYIAQAAPFARPILEKLRELVHQGCPQVEETIKWGVPHFEYKGMLVGMAGFKEHVGWGFWKSKLMRDPQGIFGGDPKESPFAMKPRTLADLPPDEVFLAYLAEAVRLNEEGAKVPREKSKKKAEIEVPDDLRAALVENAEARATFEGFSYSNRKEYVEWLTEAKREETRKKRLATAIEWLAEGKPRNWKYMKQWQA